MKRDANWQKYLSLNQRKYADRVVVIAGGQLIGAGRGGDVARLLARARRKFPKETPLIGHIRDPRKVYVY